jgi:hypothetical protein
MPCAPIAEDDAVWVWQMVVIFQYMHQPLDLSMA